MKTIKKREVPGPCALAPDRARHWARLTKRAGKIVVGILGLILVALIATGCGDDDATATPPANVPETPVVTSATPTPTVRSIPTTSPTPTPVPSPTPTPTPLPTVAISNYTYIWKSDAKRGINYQIPTHWELRQSGDKYLVYYEPVGSWMDGCRLAMAVKKVSREPDASAMRAQLKAFMEDASNAYDGFTWDQSIGREASLVKFKGYTSYYEFISDHGTKMRSFIIMSTYNRRIYLFNFTCPLDRFEEMSQVGARILQTVVRYT